MFFLLRVAFWLTIVLALLPTGGTQDGAQAQAGQAKFGATEAVVAAGAAVSDMSNFCDRQPTACVVGAEAAVAIGQRAQAGAKLVYDFINDRASRGNETGSVAATKVAAVRTVPASPGSQSTLKPADLDPTWRGPASRSEAMPLPKPRPHLDLHRKA